MSHALMQAASVEKYDSRNAVGISEAVKWQHVLPFMPALTMFMTACEHAVAVNDSGEDFIIRQECRQWSIIQCQLLESMVPRPNLGGCRGKQRAM